MIEDYSKIYLEKLDMDDDYLDVVRSEGHWESEDFAPLVFITINEVEGGISYGCDIYSSDNSPGVQRLNVKLRAKGYELSGHGWERFMKDFIDEKVPGFTEKMNFDSEAETCGMFIMSSPERFYIMLTIISDGIRDLLSE